MKRAQLALRANGAVQAVRCSGFPTREETAGVKAALKRVCGRIPPVQR